MCAKLYLDRICRFIYTVSLYGYMLRPWPFAPKNGRLPFRSLPLFSSALDATWPSISVDFLSTIRLLLASVKDSWRRVLHRCNVFLFPVHAVRCYTAIYFRILPNYTFPTNFLCRFKALRTGYLSFNGEMSRSKMAPGMSLLIFSGRNPPLGRRHSPGAYRVTETAMCETWRAGRWRRAERTGPLASVSRPKRGWIIHARRVALFPRGNRDVAGGNFPGRVALIKHGRERAARRQRIKDLARVSSATFSRKVAAFTGRARDFRMRHGSAGSVHSARWSYNLAFVSREARIFSPTALKDILHRLRSTPEGRAVTWSFWFKLYFSLQDMKNATLDIFFYYLARSVPLHNSKQSIPPCLCVRDRWDFKNRICRG